MTYSWHSSRGMRRGLVIALAALCLWMGWLIGWVMKSNSSGPVLLELQPIPGNCSVCKQTIIQGGQKT